MPRDWRSPAASRAPMHGIPHFRCVARRHAGLPQSATAALSRSRPSPPTTRCRSRPLRSALQVISQWARPAIAIDGTISSAGLAAFFASTISDQVSGKIGKSGVSPDSDSVDYVYGKKTRRRRCDSPRAMSSRSPIPRAAAAPPGLGAGRRQRCWRCRSDGATVIQARRVPSAGAR